MPATRLLAPLVCLALTTACISNGGGRSADAGVLPANVSTRLAPVMEHDDRDAFRAAAVEQGLPTAAGGVLLDIQTDGLLPEHRAAFDLPGLTVRSFRPEYERVSAIATSADAIRGVAALPNVRAVVPAAEARTRDEDDGGY